MRAEMLDVLAGWIETVILKARCEQRVRGLAGPAGTTGTQPEHAEKRPGSSFSNGSFDSISSASSG